MLNQSPHRGSNTGRNGGSGKSPFQCNLFTMITHKNTAKVISFKKDC